MADFTRFYGSFRGRPRSASRVFFPSGAIGGFMAGEFDESTLDVSAISDEQLVKIIAEWLESSARDSLEEDPQRYGHSNGTWEGADMREVLREYLADVPLGMLVADEAGMNTGSVLVYMGLASDRVEAIDTESFTILRDRMRSIGETWPESDQIASDDIADLLGIP